jgi:TonB-linked outer membrane protein, SusC/RagA family/TonB-dependent outer membrane receptor, SusC/RagA subfamily, signature region
MKKLISTFFERKNISYNLLRNIFSKQLCSLLILITSINAYAADPHTYSGKITDINGDPIAGATIINLNNNCYALSDKDGFYEISKTKIGDILQFSFVGMKPIEVKVSNNKIINITLEHEMALEELIVTGYQTLSKRELASAVTQVKVDDIKLPSAQTLDQMLVGQVPGLNIMQTSGEPGAAPKVRIRGTSSIYGNRSPLWVLDGIILTEDIKVDPANLIGDDATYLIGNAISGINPSDIETITILKDASATAIYGVQAANGVIVITTKKGVEGKSKISYNGSFTIGERPYYGNLYQMNAAERIQLSREIIDGYHAYSQMPRKLGYEKLYLDYLNNQITYDQFVNDVDEMAKRNTDWYDILFRNSISHRHSINLSGGVQNTRYYTSISVDNNQGTAKGSLSRRYTANANVNSWLNKKLFIGIQVNGSITQNNGYHASFNPNNYAFNTARTIPCYNSDGSLYFYETKDIANWSNKGDRYRYNAINEINKTGSLGKVANLTAKVDLNWHIINGLEYRFMGSYQHNQTKSTSFAEEDSYYMTNLRGYSKEFYDTVSEEDRKEVYNKSRYPVGGELSKSERTAETYMLRNTLLYNKNFNDHFINLQGISEIRSIKNDGFAGTYYGWQPDRGQTIAPVLTADYRATNPIITDNVKNYVSWIGIASYSYKDKFTLNGNIRADGTNQFGSNPKYRFLPIWSIAGKYTISNENFLKDNKTISYFAIRADYGIQGNVDPNTSPDLVIRVGSQNPLTQMYESYINLLPNANLRWEKTKSYNIGLDMALFNDRLSFVVDYYNKKGSDMILNKTISQVMGIKYSKINGGKVNNSGIEVGVTAIPILTKDFNLSIGINYSYNSNKLIKANEQNTVTITEMLNGNGLIEGEPLGVLYSYDFAGLNHDTGYPIFRDKYGKATVKLDEKGNLSEDGKDIPNYSLYEDEIGVVKSGLLEAPHYGGFNINIGYKGFRLSTSFNYQFGGVGRLPAMYNGGNAEYVFDPERNVTKEMNNRWRNPGDEANTNLPKLYNQYEFKKFLTRPYQMGRTEVDGIRMYDRSTARIASTDFLRLRNIGLIYNFNKKLITNMGLSNLAVSFNISNLFIIADKAWHGKDPESGYSNIPIPRTYSFSLDLTF